MEDGAKDCNPVKNAMHFLLRQNVVQCLGRGYNPYCVSAKNCGLSLIILDFLKIIFFIIFLAV